MKFTIATIIAFLAASYATSIHDFVRLKHSNTETVPWLKMAVLLQMVLVALLAVLAVLAVLTVLTVLAGGVDIIMDHLLG